MVENGQFLDLLNWLVKCYSNHDQMENIIKEEFCYLLCFEGVFVPVHLVYI